MGLRIASWVQKSLASGSPQFTRTAPIEVEPPVQFFGDVTIRAPHSNPDGSESRSIMAVLFEDESGAVVDNAHPRAGEIPWGWTTGVGGGRWYSYIHTDDSTRAITVPQGLRLSLVGLYGWDGSSTARTVGAFTIEGDAMAEAQVARYARPDGTLTTIGEARVWDGQWRTIYTSWEPRIVTITSNYNGSRWEPDTAVGDTSLFSSIGDSLTNAAPVICDKLIQRATLSDNFPAGTVIPAGTNLIYPGIRNSRNTYTFTEVRT